MSKEELRIEALLVEGTIEHSLQVELADDTLKFMQIHDSEVPEITPEQEVKLKRKVYWRVLGITFLVNLIMYMDKATLSYSSILGFWEATGLDQNKYNNANTMFYVGYIIAVFPMMYVIQKLPLSKVILVITSLWTVIIFLHCAAFSYGGVMALRFFLGFVESAAIPLLTTTNGMFFTSEERARTQPIFYASCLGSSIPVGFIAYGTIYAKASIKDYRVLNIIIGGLTLLVTILVYFVYPDNPVSAKFLSIEEKVWVVRRVQRSTNSSIEQKVFKKKHFIECFKDPISWLISGFFLFQQLANNLPYQQTLLFENMGGVSNLTSTLVTVAGSGWSLFWALLAYLFMRFYPNSTAFTIIWTTLPALIGSILAVSLDLSNSKGILISISMAATSFGVPWICAFGFGVTTAGSSYSKRLTRNGMIIASYSIANIISPQIWQAQDAPRYVPAWIVQIVLSFTLAPSLIGIMWFILKKRNVARLAKMRQEDKLGTVRGLDGECVVVLVANLDLTDLEDETFIYPL